MTRTSDLRWRPRRQASPWLAAAGIVLTALSFIADKWQGPSWVLFVLGLAAALGGVLLENRARAAARVDDQRDLVDRSSRALVDGRFPLVAAVDLADYRVHRTTIELPYVARDRQSELRDRLVDGLPVLVIGHSLAGKTRMTVEVIRAQYGTPRSADGS